MELSLLLTVMFLMQDTVAPRYSVLQGLRYSEDSVIPNYLPNNKNIRQPS